MTRLLPSQIHKARFQCKTSAKMALPAQIPFFPWHWWHRNTPSPRCVRQHAVPQRSDGGDAIQAPTSPFCCSFLTLSLQASLLLRNTADKAQPSRGGTLRGRSRAACCLTSSSAQLGFPAALLLPPLTPPGFSVPQHIHSRSALECAYRTHLVAGIGFYQHLLLYIQSHYQLELQCCIDWTHVTDPLMGGCSWAAARWGGMGWDGGFKVVRFRPLLLAGPALAGPVCSQPHPTNLEHFQGGGQPDP